MYKRTSFAMLALSASAAVMAAEPADELGKLKQLIDEQAQQLGELKQSLHEQQRKAEQARRTLDVQQEQIEQLQRQVENQNVDLNRRAQPDGVLELYAGRGTPGAGQQQAQNQAPAAANPNAAPNPQQPAGANAPAATGTQPPAGGPGTVGQAPEKPKDTKPPEVAPLFQQPGVLTPKARLMLEPSLQYDYSTNNRAAIAGYSVLPSIVIGLIDVRTVNRSTWTAALTGRYGLTNRLEVEARVPFVYRRDSTIARPFGENNVQTERAFTADGSKIGDAEITARYQINQPAPDKAYYVGSIRFKTRTGESPFEVETFSPFAGSGLLQKELPTGSGFYGLQLGLSALYPSDPVVFFGNVSYLHNFERNVGNGYGRIDPGDIFGFSFGMGLGLNEKASFSLGYEHSVVGKLEQNGVVPPATTSTQLGTLSLGYSYRSSTKRTWNWSLGIGVTKDTPDVTLRLRVPTTVTKN